MLNAPLLASCLAAMAVLVSTATPAFADRDKHHDYYRHDDDDDNDDHGHKKKRPVVIYQNTVIYQAPVVFTGGPPPWAPAHGYRRKHDGEVVYAAPYGIDTGHCYREQVGQIVGGVGGAVLGSQIGQGTGKIVATAGGTLLGVLIGGAIGRSLDQADYACAGQILEHVPDNRAIIWSNPQIGATYRMVPTKAYEVQGGGYCREYTSTATIAGRTQQVYGTACRQPDGSWKIISQ